MAAPDETEPSGAEQTPRPTREGAVVAPTDVDGHAATARRFDPGDVAGRLETETLVDIGDLLDARGRAVVLTALERARARRLRAYVVCLPLGAPFDDVDALFAAAAAGHPAETLLVVFNGRGWRGRGLGLPIARIKRELTEATPVFGVDRGRGLALAIDRLLAARSTEVRDATENIGEDAGGSLPLVLGVSLGVASLVGSMAWLMARRRRRAREESPPQGS